MMMCTSAHASERRLTDPLPASSRSGSPKQQLQEKPAPTADGITQPLPVTPSALFNIPSAAPPTYDGGF
ncbi:unnamed protein product [Arctogadus glacialis]